MLSFRVLGGVPRMFEGTPMPQARIHMLSSAWAVFGLLVAAASMGLLLWMTEASFPVIAMGGAMVLLLLGSLHAYAHLALLTPDPSSPALSGPGLQRRLFWLAVMMGVMMLPLTQPLALFLAKISPPTQIVTPEAIRARATLALAKEQESQARLALAASMQLAHQTQLPVTWPSVAPGSPSSGPAEIATSAPNPALPSAPASTPVVAPLASTPGNTPPANPPMPSPLQGLATRKALVVGNGRYAPPNTELPGALQDAQDMAKALRALSFEVTMIQDASRTDLEMAIETYTASLKPGDISFFHFSGHGLQLRGDNYLVPVEMRTLGDGLAPPATSVNTLIEAIAKRKPLASIVAIDACRSGVSGLPVKGLAPIELGRNTYIAMAAAPGQEALEENDPNTVPRGFFSASLASRIKEPIDIDLVFRAVRNDVLRKSGGRQTPWSSVGLEGQLILASAGAGRAMQSPQAQALALSTPTSRSSGTGRPSSQPIGSGTPLTCGGEALGQPGRQQQDARCISARMAMQADELEEASKRVADLARAAELADQTVASEIRRLRTAWLSFWSEPLAAGALTLSIWGLMAGGFWVRSRLVVFHEAYALKLHEQTTALVRDFSDRAFAVAGALVWAHPSDRLKDRFFARFGTSQQEVQPPVEKALWHSFLGLPSTTPAES